MLIVAVFAFKVADLHKYFHKGDDQKGNPCELCLVLDKNKNLSDFYLPEAYQYDTLNSSVAADVNPTFYYTFYKNVRFPFGKSLNKPPPYPSV